MLLATTPLPTKLIALAPATTSVPSSFTVIPELLIVIVATLPTLLAVTALPTKLIVFAVANTLVPSSCTAMPVSPPGIVIVATPLTLLAVTPLPTKFSMLAEATTLVPSSCTAIVLEPPPPFAAVYWKVPSANLIPNELFATFATG